GGPERSFRAQPEPALSDARGARRRLHDRRDLRRAPRALGHVRRAAARTELLGRRAMRILLVSQMYPGPDDPDLGTFVAQVECALRERGHEIELAVLDRRSGGKARYAS